MTESLATVLAGLRAAAEPTRLRLLALLTHGELTVGEISTILEQSQPRISRHLKLLCDAGLLDRFREEHWVYYRAATTGLGQELAARLTGLIAKNDPTLETDRRRMAQVLAERVQPALARLEAAAWPVSCELPGELHAVLLEELGTDPVGELLDIGTGTGLILRTLGARATRAVGVDISTEALRIARTHTHGAGLSHCLFRRADMYGLPFTAATFDTVIMDRVLADAERPEAAIAEAARTLRPGGRLCLIEDYDACGDRVAGNPVATLRNWLAAARLCVERVRPFDTDEMHLFIAIARAPFPGAQPVRQAA